MPVSSDSLGAFAAGSLDGWDQVALPRDALEVGLQSPPARPSDSGLVLHTPETLAGSRRPPSAAVRSPSCLTWLPVVYPMPAMLRDFFLSIQFF